ncbi:NAD(P)-dependent oxidoreductase [Actinoplanes sp. NPDC051513]|uniref:NAD(P)-dependent oxidoreductase n=1 Tax=Actinoplanes sp. NPDC051513 TaxID=3363908 RepID=UPI0037910F1D
MRMTVFGATGGIGRHVVRQALDAGHTVTAVVRDSARIDARHRALEVVTVPGLTDPAMLVPALEASDAAISGVGPRHRKDGPVASTATRGILLAMEASPRRATWGQREIARRGRRHPIEADDRLASGKLTAGGRGGDEHRRASEFLATIYYVSRISSSDRTARLGRSYRRRRGLPDQLRCTSTTPLRSRWRSAPTLTPSTAAAGGVFKRGLAARPRHQARGGVSVWPPTATASCRTARRTPAR